VPPAGGDGLGLRPRRSPGNVRSSPRKPAFVDGRMARSTCLVPPRGPIPVPGSPLDVLTFMRDHLVDPGLVPGLPGRYAPGTKGGHGAPAYGRKTGGLGPAWMALAEHVREDR